MAESPHSKRDADVGISHGQIVQLILVFIISFAFMGFVFGINEKPTATQVPHVTQVDSGLEASHVPEAVSYSEIGEASLGPNANWKSNLRDIARPSFDPDVPAEQNRTGLDAVLAGRTERRAFDGAPPVVPHPIDQMTSAACIACHGEGIQVGDKVASKMSHQMYGSCTQCHVEQTRETIVTHSAFVGVFGKSTFQGAPAPQKGERAYVGAPPTVPHTTWMRDNCLSCHGAAGSAPLRTSHPWRVSCLQCHAPSAELDQHQFETLLKQVVSNQKDTEQ